MHTALLLGGYALAVPFLAIAIALIFGTLPMTGPTPTNRYMNSSGWGFTPTGGTATSLLGITSCSYEEGISIKKASADFDTYPTVAVRDYAEPKINLETLDAQVLSSVIGGAFGVLVGTLRDAYNGATTGGGAKLLTFSNAFIESRGWSAPYREFAKQQLSFGAISTDGATSPLAITAV